MNETLASRPAGSSLLRGRLWTWGLAAIFTLAGVYAVWKSLGSASTLLHVHVVWLDVLLAVLFYPPFAALRGVRFRYLLKDGQSARETIGLGFFYSAVASVLPGGFGDLSLPFIYRRASGGYAHTTAATAVARVQDLLTWLLVLAFGGFAVAQLPTGYYAAIGVSLLVTAVASLLVFSPRVRRATFRALRVLRWEKLHSFLGQLDDRLGGMVYDLPSWLVTVALRLLSILSYYFALRAFGADVTFVEASVGGALAALLLTLPVQGVAGLGTVEVWWIMILRLFGTPWSVAAVAAIGVHMTLLLSSLAVGALSLRTAPRLLSTD